MPESTPPQEPTKGGSYQRDPVTGALTQLHQTAPAEPALQADPAQAEQPAATTQPEA